MLALGIHDRLLEIAAIESRFQTPEEAYAQPEFRAVATTIDELVLRARAIVRDYKKVSAIHLYLSRLVEVMNSSPDEPGMDVAAAIGAITDTLRGASVRLDHMRAAALSAVQRSHLVRLIERSGCTVTESEPLAYADEPNIGTTLVAIRSV